jgi:hypothetical protein
MDSATFRLHTLLLRAAKMMLAAWEEWIQTKAPAQKM